jgi:Fe-S-cluster containining protein
MKDHFTVLNGSIRFDGKCDETKAYCGAVCCKNTIVLLTDEEKKSGTYDYTMPKDTCSCSTCNLMRQTGQVSLRRNDAGCTYLDGMNRCSIYENRPKMCRSFVCEQTWWKMQLMKGSGNMPAGEQIDE